MVRNYTPAEIASVCGVSQWLVTRYLRSQYPRHWFKTWWRLDEDEYSEVCRVLKSAKICCPKHPLRAIKSAQIFLELG